MPKTVKSVKKTPAKKTVAKKSISKASVTKKIVKKAVATTKKVKAVKSKDWEKGYTKPITMFKNMSDYFQLNTPYKTA